MLKFKKNFEWLREKPLIMLFRDGATVHSGGLFGGQWSPHSGGGFGGTGIPEANFVPHHIMGWVIEERLMELKKPDLIGFSHTPGGMKKWPLAEVFEEEG